MKNLQNHIFSTTTCISKETMLKFINKQLSQKELHQVQTHLIDCDFCSEALEGMAHAKNPSVLFTIDHLIDKRTTQKSPSITRIFLVAASVLLFVFGGYYTINNFNEVAQMKDNVISFQEPQKNAIETNIPEQEELMREQKEADGEKSAQTSTIKLEKNAEVVDAEVAEIKSNDKWKDNYGTLEESPIEQQVAKNDYRPVLTKDKTTTSAATTSTGSAYKAKIQDSEDAMMDVDNTIAPAPIMANEKAKADANIDQKATNQLASKAIVSDNLKKSGETKNRAKKEKEAPRPSSADDFNREGDEITLKEEETVTRNENTSFVETITTTETSGELATGVAIATQNFLADGITNYKQKKYKEAIQNFDLILAETPTTTKTYEAKWYKALCLIELKDITNAKKLLSELTYVNNPFSKQAEEKLKELK